MELVLPVGTARAIWAKMLVELKIWLAVGAKGRPTMGMVKHQVGTKELFLINKVEMKQAVGEIKQARGTMLLVEEAATATATHGNRWKPG